MSIFKKIIITIILLLACSQWLYYLVTDERFYFSGIYVTCLFEKNEDLYVRDPKLFFENGHFSAKVKTFFYENENFIQDGEDYSLVSRGIENEIIQEKKINVTPHVFYSTMLNKKTGKMWEEKRFQFMFSVVLNYSDKIKKIQLYKGSMLIAEAEVKK